MGYERHAPDGDALRPGDGADRPAALERVHVLLPVRRRDHSLRGPLVHGLVPSRALAPLAPVSLAVQGLLPCGLPRRDSGAADAAAARDSRTRVFVTRIT